MFSKLPHYARGPVSDRAFFSPRHNFYFARIPKCANSTLVKTFAYHCGFDFEYDYHGAITKDWFNRYPSVKAFSKATKVTFVRHPVTRALSGWLDKGHLSAYIKKHRYAGSETQVPTFTEFLESLAENEFFHNAHFLPQIHLIPGNPSDYYIGVVEQIETDLPKICEQAFGQYRGINNVEHGRRNATAQLETISSHERELIQQLYAEDFVLYDRVINGDIGLQFRA